MAPQPSEARTPVLSALTASVAPIIGRRIATGTPRTSAVITLRHRHVRETMPPQRWLWSSLGTRQHRKQAEQARSGSKEFCENPMEGSVRMELAVLALLQLIQRRAHHRVCRIL